MSSIKNFSMLKKCLSFPELTKEFLTKYLTKDIIQLINLNTLKFYKNNDEFQEIIYFSKQQNNGVNSTYVLIQYLPKLDFIVPLKACLSVERIIKEHMINNNDPNYPRVCVCGFYNGDENDPKRKNCIDIHESIINNIEFATYLNLKYNSFL